ncbi:hypothetical protein B6D16_01015 [Gilliamella apicola]|uniref:hypothetical protein n=1 Tax=Gilliamella apicola TaxID=1196095 RepID=UPI000A35C197|nr:hypothetical protein [Gilliamella apicola]OTP97229.1 hypothetical protein B6D05_01670 [Gilliamella apicola]OTQ19284.1 hypothetical protein B6D15_02475 [Gilliamella apicola]OTQ21695.1 hypothetical protein B6D16_01015 [Gilliamella apicola]OTQ23002.1 hypothetical protein B6D04_10855 [Gilliamella apicola]
MNKITVNILSIINKSSKITKKMINNKEHYIIRDVVPVVDDVVMNNGLYPKDEIDKSYKSINGNLMPIGHPKVNGQFVSASMAKAINDYYGGAWAENVHKDQDKVLLDCYVDIEFARNHEKGKQLLERLDAMFNGEDVNPIHVSTGLILNKVYKTGKSKGRPYEWVATNMQFDHVAILLNEQGAATPNEGVGMFVNSEGEYQIEFASLNESSTQSIQNLIANAVHNALQKLKFNKQEEPDPMKEKILAALNAKGIKTDGLTDEQLLVAFNEQAAKDAIDKKKAEDEEKEKKAKESAQNQEQAPAWFKDFSKRFEAVEQVVNANINNEEQAMRAAVKTKFGMSDTAVNALSGEPLKELYAQCQTSVGLNSATNQFNKGNSLLNMEAPE